MVTGFENVDASGSSVAVTLTGDDNANVLTGGDGDDTLTGGLGADTVSGGAGDDTIHYTIGDGADAIDGGTHTAGDTLVVLGTAGDDTLDVIVTGTTITGLEGGTVTGIETVTYDALGQSSGGDTLSYAGSTDAVTVNLSGTQSATGFATIAGRRERHRRFGQRHADRRRQRQRPRWRPGLGHARRRRRGRHHRLRRERRVDRGRRRDGHA